MHADPTMGDGRPVSNVALGYRHPRGARMSVTHASAADREQVHMQGPRKRARESPPGFVCPRPRDATRRGALCRPGSVRPVTSVRHPAYCASTTSVIPFLCVVPSGARRIRRTEDFVPGEGRNRRGCKDLDVVRDRSSACANIGWGRRSSHAAITGRASQLDAMTMFGRRRLQAPIAGILATRLGRQLCSIRRTPNESVEKCLRCSGRVPTGPHVSPENGCDQRHPTRRSVDSQPPTSPRRLPTPRFADLLPKRTEDSRTHQSRA